MHNLFVAYKCFVASAVYHDTENLFQRLFNVGHELILVGRWRESIIMKISTGTV